MMRSAGHCLSPAVLDSRFSAPDLNDCAVLPLFPVAGPAQGQMLLTSVTLCRYIYIPSPQERARWVLSHLCPLLCELYVCPVLWTLFSQWCLLHVTAEQNCFGKRSSLLLAVSFIFVFSGVNVH